MDLYVDEDIKYKVVSPLKFHNMLFKKVKLILTRDATGFINTQDFAAPIEASQISQLVLNTHILKTINLVKLGQFLSKFISIEQF